ncbi:hypothetical protein [Cobetia sp. 29-18-1]|uniref:hypothetical protein n=1 Tax=Cobetia sp. 29-18-1 TaxID=3040018 RepID=UPI00244BCADC|nr:hypothetical protein [Cobetia sp. 29-18-1]MDH2298733.1 hypothetical protein [Cobetia sp. 29-18-1]
MSGKKKGSKPNRYVAIIQRIFDDHYVAGITEFEFERVEAGAVAADLGITLPSNVGDIFYSFRYRYELPDAIKSTAAPGLEWIIEGAGVARYRFKQVKLSRIVPREDLVTVKIPDATPEIIGVNALGDEQGLLAKVRYNRLIDIFLGIAAYSLQNHLRTTVKGLGQIEIDEIYVGVNSNGQQYVIPVQAKGGKDKHGSTQTEQDMRCCVEKFPDLICRAVSVQFMEDSRIAMFELIVEDDEIKVVREKHYRLVPSSEILSTDLDIYARME